MALNSTKEMVEAEIEGRMRNYAWRKTPTQTTTAGYWFDLAMSPGIPVPKYWFDSTPGVAKSISQSGDGGFFHGANVSPYTKYARQITTRTAGSTGTPIHMKFCDYLLYYPSVDDSITNPQVLDNTVTLPRYEDGAGVQCIAVSVAGRTGGQQFYFTYTNSDGVSGRVSQTVTQNSASAIGTIQCGNTSAAIAATPFVGLQLGDTGIRSIESVTMLGADVGLMTLILVKPLFDTTIKELGTPYEKDLYLGDSGIPEIKDDAFVNAVVCPNGTLAAGLFFGDFKVIWN